MSTVDPVPAAATGEPARYGRLRLAGGVLGRAWLWFLAGCLLITLLPVVFGWRSFLVESGSMAPRIDVGDVVIAAPEQEPQSLLGRVAVFTDPDLPSRYKTHRVIAVDDAGGLVTRGDSNPTDDPTPVRPSEVFGIGRLLVPFIGLPVIWAQTGQWGWLALGGASIVLACWLIRRDQEDPDEDESDRSDPSSGGAADGDETEPVPTAALTAVVPPVRAPVLRATRVRRWAFRLGYGGALAAVVLLPTSAAAFTRTTDTAQNSWAAPNWSYADEVDALNPYLYWRLDETSTSTGTAGRTAADSSGNGNTGQYNTNGGTTYFTKNVTGALVTDSPNRAVTLRHDSSCINTTSSTMISAQNPVSVVIWFKATSGYASGGKLAGFEKPRTGTAAPSTGTYDRHLYMDGDGYVWFGVYNSGFVTVRSTSQLDDGGWHMAVGTVGASGTRLYIDGVLQAASSNTQGEATDGVWRAGCGNLAGWGGSWGGGNNPTTDSTTTRNRTFLGSLDEFAVFTTALTPAQISMLWAAR